MEIKKRLTAFILHRGQRHVLQCKFNHWHCAPHHSTCNEKVREDSGYVTDRCTIAFRKSDTVWNYILRFANRSITAGIRLVPCYILCDWVYRVNFNSSSLRSIQFVDMASNAEPVFVPEIGPDGIVRESPMISYTEKVLSLVLSYYLIVCAMIVLRWSVRNLIFPFFFPNRFR